MNLVSGGVYMDEIALRIHLDTSWGLKRQSQPRRGPDAVPHYLQIICNATVRGGVCHL